MNSYTLINPYLCSQTSIYYTVFNIPGISSHEGVFYSHIKLEGEGLSALRISIF